MIHPASPAVLPRALHRSPPMVSSVTNKIWIASPVEVAVFVKELVLHICIHTALVQRLSNRVKLDDCLVVEGASSPRSRRADTASVISNDLCFHTGSRVFSHERECTRYQSAHVCVDQGVCLCVCVFRCVRASFPCCHLVCSCGKPLFAAVQVPEIARTTTPAYVHDINGAHTSSEPHGIIHKHCVPDVFLCTRHVHPAVPMLPAKPPAEEVEEFSVCIILEACHL